jgi:hypothetical protein
MARKVLQSIDLTTELLLSGSAGTSGQVLSSGGAGAPPTWQSPSALSIVHETIDLVGTGKYTIINDDVADTLIAATSKPSSPQYTRTIGASEIPDSEYVEDWMALFCIAGRNTDSSTRTINYRFTLNGTEIGTLDGTLSPTTSSSYWRAVVPFAANALAANDVLGVKMWASVANVVDYRAVIIYIIPRKYYKPDNVISMHFFYNTSNYETDVLSGSISGYSFSSVNFHSSFVAGGLTTLLSPTANTMFSVVNERTRMANCLTDATPSSSSIGSSAQLYSVRINRYFYITKVV